MQYLYKDELDRSQYRSIEVLKKPDSKKKKREDKSKDPDKKRPYDKIGEPSLDEEGYTRLFIARGRNDGITKRDLVNIIIAQSGVDNDDIHDVQVMEEFSFVNAPYAVAEHILKVFDKRNYGGAKPLITKARAEGKTSSKGKKDKDIKRGARGRGKERMRDEEFEDSRYRYKRDSKHSSRGSKAASKSKARKGKRK